jgi:tetraprenyl-beta-curcumene synthase
VDAKPVPFVFTHADRRIAVSVAFASAARRYWLEVFPVVRHEVFRLRQRAEEIPDPVLRRLALSAQAGKWDNLEGAAAFAVFAPHGQRAAVARLLVGLQSIYDYADTLMEQSCREPTANARQLHSAILAALTPGGPHLDYYAYNACQEDGGYLVDLVDTCRAAIDRLPSYAAIAEVIQRNARRIVVYQSRIILASQCDYPTLIRWASNEVPPDVDLRWWEIGAACGSSMALFSLVAAAAHTGLRKEHAAEIEETYWPWIGALHTLLDSLIDRREDAATGQHNLLDNYASVDEMAGRMWFLAAEAARRVNAAGIEQSLILAAVTSLCLSDKRAWLPESRATTERVLAAVGDLTSPAMFILRVRRFAHRLGH